MTKKSTRKSNGQLVRLKWFHERIAEGSFPTPEDVAEEFKVAPSTAYKDIEFFKKTYNPPLEYDLNRQGFYYSDPNYRFGEISSIEEPTGDGQKRLSSSRATPGRKTTSTRSKATAKKEDGKVLVREDLDRTAETVQATPSILAKPKPKKRKTISGRELVSILLMEELSKKYETSPFRDSIRSAMEKFIKVLDDPVTYDVPSLEKILTAEVPAFPSVDLTIFDALIQAVENRESVVLKYFSGQKASITDKPCDPYYIINYKDNWYLVAFCHEKQDYRDFLINRIISIEYTGTKFAPDPKFNIEEHKKKSQLFKGMSVPMEVIVEFDKYAAHWIRVRPIHPTQKIKERPDGSLEISFKLYTFENIIRWVLSFGEHARVLAPPDLQERVRKAISRMNFLYNRL